MADAYRRAGVDIEAGEALVDAIKPAAAATRRPGADATLGGFGGVFDLKACGYDDPLLVSGTDGVGTKLLVAIETGRHEGVGIDLVAMCANDILAQGAEPLFFLDYYATSKLEVDVAAAVVRGVAEGCRRAGCALIGGETAEMPGVYKPGDYDLAGFCVGAVERERLLPGEAQAGDVLIGLPSSGPHSNGFSLIRKIVKEAGADWSIAAPFASKRTLAEAMLEPTRIYVRELLPLMQAGRLRAAAHITGGGLVENPPRALPAHLRPRIDRASWETPALFQWLAEAGGLDEADLLQTFNCGVGMMLVVAPEGADALLSDLSAASAFVMGDVAAAG
ncbi:MAG: phosphoribosylformylglycinamidine cyclo-ligase [Pseudomonadota bacterium]